MSDVPPPRELYLSIDEQRRNILRLQDTIKLAPLHEKIFVAHAPDISLVTTGLMYFLSVRAGIKCYGLARFGKARLLCFVGTCAFLINGYLAHNYVNEGLYEPYRVESASYYGLRHALFNQLAISCNTVGPIVFTFLCADRLKLLPVIDEKYKPGFRTIVVQSLYKRVRPYLKPIGATAVASTALMYFVGTASYHQSCNMIAKMGRKTLCQREDNELL